MIPNWKRRDIIIAYTFCNVDYSPQRARRAQSIAGTGAHRVIKLAGRALMEEFVRNKSKERLLVEAKALRRYMKFGESAALLIRDDRDARSQS